jgi:hypothetical protein
MSLCRFRALHPAVLNGAFLGWWMVHATDLTNPTSHLYCGGGGYGVLGLNCSRQFKRRRKPVNALINIGGEAAIGNKAI